MNIGVCGMGRMGAAMAQRLVSVGHSVWVWNRDAAKTEPLVALGAKAAKTPQDVASHCDIIITMLLNDKAIDTVLRGDHGLLSADLTGKLVIEMSTVLPEVQEAARRQRPRRLRG